MRIIYICPNDQATSVRRQLDTLCPVGQQATYDHLPLNLIGLEESILEPGGIGLICILIDPATAQGRNGGPQAVRDLMMRLEGEHSPAILLMGIASRELLWKYFSPADRAVLKCFPFVQLPSTRLPKWPTMPLSKWRYLRRYALTKGGVIDKLIHDVRNAIRAGILGRTGLDNVVQQLRGLPDISDESIQLLLAEYEPDNADGPLLKWAGMLIAALERRAVVFQPGRLLSRMRQAGTRRPRLMLVEDDLGAAAALRERFEEHFQVVLFHDGAEAIEELKVGGRFYSALVSDLELLEDNGRFDQPVQGIEVLEYAKEHHPHIARRVITSLGRLGVRDLLPEIRLEEILFKAQLARQGPDGLFMEFLEKLLSDVDDRRALQDMHGPDSTLWADVSKERNQQDSKGGGFKRFYYQLKVEDNVRFNKMWAGIKETLERIQEQKAVAEIDGAFLNPGKAKKLLEERDRDYNIGFLTKLLLHRAIMYTRYIDGEEVRYRDDNDKENSYIHWTGWKKAPIQSPKLYRYFTGFGAVWQKPTDPGPGDRTIVFKLVFGPLFPEEVELIQTFPQLHAGRISQFYKSHRELCYCINDILGIIRSSGEHQGRSVFSGRFPLPMENPENMEGIFARTVLEALSREQQGGQRPRAKEAIYDRLLLFRDGTEDFEEQDGTPEFNALPEEMKVLLDECLRIL